MKIYKAEKSDKKAIVRFYKAQHYSASFLGFDQVYYIKEKQQIIAAMIVSKINPQHNHHFLHALVVDKLFQQQGIASKLLQFALTYHQPLVCFANENLSSFYIKNCLLKLTNDQIAVEVPEHLLLRFESYRKKHSQLKVFISPLIDDKTSSLK